MTNFGSATLRMGLRPPRVAIIFDGGAQWRFWARLALHACTNIWGGSGFIVIPHRDGNVDPQVLRAVRAYDPDYVVTLQRTIRTAEQAKPGSVSLSGEDGQPVSSERRAALIESHGDNEVGHSDDEAARVQVLGFCSSHRRRSFGPAEGWHEDFTSISPSAAEAGRLIPISAIPGSYQGPCLQAPPDWGGLLGVAIASRCGAVVEPSNGDDPDLPNEDLIQLIQWLLAGEERIGEPLYELIWHPTVAMSSDPATQPLALNRTAHGLIPVSYGVRQTPTMLVVVGDAPEDFALAHAYRAIYGRAVWLPSSWLSFTPGGTTSLFVTRMAIRSALHGGGYAAIITTSVPEQELTSVVASLRQPIMWTEGDEANEQARQKERIKTGPITWDTNGKRHLAIEDQFDMDFAVPVIQHDNGDIEMSARCPLPAVTEPDLAATSGLHWQVDIDIEEATTPRGRELDGTSLLADGESKYQTWVRSSRNGITFESGRYDFILAGTPANARLARPRFRTPGLLNWANLIAQQDGNSVKLSAAGRRVAVLQRLMGDRETLAALFSGPLLPALRAFTPTTRRTENQFADDEGVNLPTGSGTHSSEGYLTFHGIAQRLPKFSDIPSLRHCIDELLTLGLLRRGLIIGCQQCHRPEFITIDDLAQKNACPRCSAFSDLTQPRWRKPTDEPRWYYDLHTLMRQHLVQNGDVPLQLSHYLRTHHRKYVDIAEIELCNPNGDAIAESDLIALADDDIITAEVKRPGTLGEGKLLAAAIKKRLLLADHLLADQILLATADAAWDDKTVNALRAGILGYPWRRSIPTLRLITGVGDATPVDVGLNVDNGAKRRGSPE